MNMFLRFNFVFLSITNSLLAGPNPDFFQKRPQGIEYPHGFLKGVATSTYQNSGHRYWPSLGYKPESNWTWFENEYKARMLVNREREGGSSYMLFASSPIDRGEKVGISADGWARMMDDVQLIKDLGCNSHRFEIPWTDLNPKQGVWNEEAFAFFDSYIDALLAAGIEPIVTVYHWVHPRWFHDLGAWEREENSAHFIAYGIELFKRFGHKVRFWCTINEPTVMISSGYILGSHAPGKKDYASLLRAFCPDIMLAAIPHNYELAGIVLAHLLQAHIELYNAIKAMPHGREAQVGIVHQMATFKPKIQEGLAGFFNNSISARLAVYFNKNFAHDLIMDFFKTGNFSYEVPGGGVLELTDMRATHSFDFFGLNFYADVTFGPEPVCNDDEVMTDMICWAIRPQSFYNAIKEVSALNKPIIVTENGICDARDDRREAWIVSYNNALMQALEDGYDVRGYCYWTLYDNFEWNMGFAKKFGLYAVDTLNSDPTQKGRILRKGSEAYRDYVRVAGLA
jgi:beta-glucosidase